jgi:hypothetical protein
MRGRSRNKSLVSLASLKESDMKEIPRFGKGFRSRFILILVLALLTWSNESTSQIRTKLLLREVPGQEQIPLESGLIPGDLDPLSQLRSDPEKKKAPVDTIALRRCIISFLGGVSIPQGAFGNTFDRGFAVTMAIEYRISQSISALVIYSRHQFRGSSNYPDMSVNQVSAQAKYYILSGPASGVFTNAGAGNYEFNPGASRIGYNVGTGAQVEIFQDFGLIATYNFYSIPNSGTTTNFSSLQGGIFFVF